MSTYVIGDVQGCYDSLQRLLEKVAFDANRDTLWFVGDLINRGPQSLETLEFIFSLPPRTVITLGNHDIHFLACAYGVSTPNSDDTLTELLASPNCMLYANWLRQQAILHYHPDMHCVCVHAGIYPYWTLEESLAYANELEAALSGSDIVNTLKHLYGNTPTHWDPSLTGYERLRFLCNAFTRMRFITEQGDLNLSEKKSGLAHGTLTPWFNVPNRPCESLTIIFGHWAALNGCTHHPTAINIDTGCVWGGKLSALRLEDRMLFSV